MFLHILQHRHLWFQHFASVVPPTFAFSIPNGPFQRFCRVAMPERVRWGILGAGGICNDFACGVVTAGGTISAIGASSLSKAKALAEKVRLPKGLGEAVVFGGSNAGKETNKCRT